MVAVVGAVNIVGTWKKKCSTHSATMSIMPESASCWFMRTFMRRACCDMLLAVASVSCCRYSSHSVFSHVIVRDPPRMVINSRAHQWNFNTWARLNFKECHSLRITDTANSGIYCFLNASLIFFQVIPYS